MVGLNSDPGFTPATLADDVEDITCKSKLKITQQELGLEQGSIGDLVEKRKQKGGRMGKAMEMQLSERLIPNKVRATQLTSLYREFDNRVYNGQFTLDGNCFYGSSQDQVLVYDTSDPYRWERLRTITGHEIRWTITDIDVSPCQKFLVYSTLDSHVNLVNLYPGETENPYMCETDSEDNVSRSFELADQQTGGFGIFSVKFSGDGREIVVGTNRKTIEVYDLVRGQTVYRVPNAHMDDINTVAFANRDYSDVIFTGSDDSLVKLWDRRTLNLKNVPEGVFVGHREGISHVSSKGDGFYLISNSKDQTLKLWDTRKMMNWQEADHFMNTHSYFSGFDYRWQPYPGANYTKKLAADRCVQTFRGHAVLGTLIRCYFSPAKTTGQRFIITGSADGRPMIYDTVTGKTVSELQTDTDFQHPHAAPVRDVSWHPVIPMITATSFAGDVCVFSYVLPDPISPPSIQ